MSCCRRPHRITIGFRAHSSGMCEALTFTRKYTKQTCTARPRQYLLHYSFAGRRLARAGDAINQIWPTQTPQAMLLLLIDEHICVWARICVRVCVRACWFEPVESVVLMVAVVGSCGASLFSHSTAATRNDQTDDRCRRRRRRRRATLSNDKLTVTCVCVCAFVSCCYVGARNRPNKCMSPASVRARVEFVCCVSALALCAEMCANPLI